MFFIAELLEAVAIIGVLVAISIPIFTAQLEKSRDAVSVANMRAAYAEAQTAILTATKDHPTVDKATVTYGTDGKATSVAVTGVSIKSQLANEWSGLNAELPFTAPADPGTPSTAAGQTLTFTYTYGTDGEIATITAAF